MADNEDESLFIKKGELTMIALVVNSDKSKAFYAHDKNYQIVPGSIIDYKTLHSYALKCLHFSDSRKCFVSERPFGFVNVLREGFEDLNIAFRIHEYEKPGFYEIYDRFKLKGKLDKVLENEN